MTLAERLGEGAAAEIDIEPRGPLEPIQVRERNAVAGRTGRGRPAALLSGPGVTRSRGEQPSER
jgi:hypothetical protein